MNVLLKYKIKTVLPALIYGGLVTIASVVLVFVQISQYSIYEVNFVTYYMDRISTNLFLVPIALVPMAVAMGMVLTQEYGNREREDFLSSLPYKKNVRFLISILPGVVFFLVYGLILSIAVIISHTMTRGEFGEIYLLSSNYELLMQMDGLDNALLRILQIVTTLLSLYIITVFSNVVSRNAVVSVVIMICIPIFPLYFTNAIKQVINIEDVTFINRLVDYTSISGLFEGAEYVRIKDYTGMEDTIGVEYMYSMFRSLTAVISIIFWGVLGYYYATKSDRNYGKFVVTKGLEKIFVVFAGICVACAVALISGTEEISKAIKLVMMCAAFVITEIVLYKIITDKGGYSYLNAKGDKK